MKPGEAFNPWRGACGFYPPEVVDALPRLSVLQTGRKFGDGHKRIYTKLVHHWGHNGPCFPGQKSLANGLGKSERAVRMILEDLEALGLISRRARGRREGGKGQTDEYTFRWHPIFEGQMAAILTGKRRRFDRQVSAVMTGKNRPFLYREETHTDESHTEKHHQEDVALSEIEEAARSAAGFARLSDDDRRFCRELDGMSPETIRAGVLLGRARRVVHAAKTGNQEPVRSLRYFGGTIQEAAQGLPAGYVEHLESWIERRAS